MSRKNLDTVEGAYAAWNRGDVEHTLAILHPEFEYVSSGVFPGIASVYRGRDGWRAFWSDFRDPWETIRITIVELRQGGDVVAASLRFEARGRDGIEVQRAFSNRWRFRDGLVASIRAYSDPNEAADALPS